MPSTHGFELLQTRDLPEMNARGRLFRHVKTGAELLSLEADDENKVFGIAFRTLPADSTGLPHILEHSVLCGSRKYPLKEPFVELVKGSLHTFLNAFTSPDKTTYPVASQNLKDFYNLIDVYVDAVLHPRLSPQILQQEGWHYELEDPQGQIAYRGVVYNEMKGAYSSPDGVLARSSRRSLFPDTLYGLDSGGDPVEIPNLTWEQFKAFHERYYHPSNAMIFFYGDDDPDERLRLMDGYLSEFGSQEVEAHIPFQPRFDRPREMVAAYDAGQGDGAPGETGKGFVTLNWLLPPADDPQTRLALSILAQILIGTPASPLRKALIDSGLGEDLTGVGLDSSLLESYFSTGLKGIAVQDAGRVETLILDTLDGLVAAGIEADLIEAAVNTVEFRLRENNTGSYPRGLLLYMRSLSTWLYGDDPFSPLAFEAPLQALKTRLAAGEPVFETLIRAGLLENPHRTRLVLEPDPDLRPREDAALQERLGRFQAGLSLEERQAIAAETQELKRRQAEPDSPETLATIPSLARSDLDPQVRRIPLEVFDRAGGRVLYHDLFTNGILYLDLGFDLQALPPDLLPYAPLFGRALLELGTETQDFVQLSRRIGRTTGGIYPTSFTSMAREGGESAAWLFLRGKAVPDRAAELLSILRDVLLTARLDNHERFRQMVLEEKADAESGLVPSGHRLVGARLRAKFNPADRAAEAMGGISSLFFLRELAEAIERDWPAVLEKLEAVRSLLLDRGRMVSNVTVDAARWEAFRPQLDEFLAALPAGAAGPPTGPAGLSQPALGNEGLAIPARVNYVGKGADLYRLGYRLDGSIHVITNYLRMSYLWDHVRVQGGAYGVFCPFDHRSGVFTFLSYRDPNLLQTLEAFDGAADFLRRLHLDERELTRAIIGAISDMDAYQLPDAKGYTSMLRYLVKETDEIRQATRDQILTAGLEDFHAFGEVLAKLNEAGQVVVLGSQEAIEAANRERAGWLEVKRVL